MTLEAQWGSDRELRLQMGKRVRYGEGGNRGCRWEAWPDGGCGGESTLRRLLAG